MATEREAFRQSSLRDTFGDEHKKKKKKKRQIVGKLSGRYRFRAAVWLVLEYMEWIEEETSLQDEIGDDVAINVRMAQRKKVPEKKGLTLQDRSVLLIEPKLRSKENKLFISQLIRNLRAFRQYPEDLWDNLAGVVRYQYVPSGRVIVKQGHKAHSLYFITKGEVTLSRIVKDKVTGDTIENDMGTMGPGDMFGQVALLYGIARTATVTTKTSVDLLVLSREDFNRILRSTLTAEWNILRDALINFNYFKAWDDVTIRECCILSKIKNYESNEVLLGDGTGMVNYVYFILSGECRLIEHMVIQEDKIGNKVKYKLYDSEKMVKSVTKIVPKKSKTERGAEDEEDRASVAKGVKSQMSELDYTQLLLSNKPKGGVDHERMSIVTTTLQDVVNQWHEITEVAAMLMREPSTTSQQQYPANVRTVFMQVCLFYRGACFGLGEKMRNRRIVSITPVRCLLIPRYWLLEHNRANIWERVRLFMDSKYPTIDQLFWKFVRNRRWMVYKRELVKNILRNGRNVPNSTTIHDVPYSIRINQEIDESS